MTLDQIMKLRSLAKGASMGGRFMLPLRVLRRVFQGADGTAELHDFDGDLSVDLRLSEHMQSRIFWMGYYSREVVATLNRLLKPGMTFIDAGANFGEISMVAAKRVGPSGKVLSIEPVSSHADTLEHNLRRNGLHWAEVVRTAVSDHVGSQEIYASCVNDARDSENLGLNSLYAGEGSGTAVESVAVTTLDALVERTGLGRIDVIKIDIEGSELPCLVGARETIARHLPYLVIEVQSSSTDAAGYKQTDILSELRRYGYQFQTTATSGTLNEVDELSLGSYQNVLCTPPGKVKIARL